MYNNLPTSFVGVLVENTDSELGHLCACLEAHGCASQPCAAMCDISSGYVKRRALWEP